MSGKISFLFNFTAFVFKHIIFISINDCSRQNHPDYGYKQPICKFSQVLINVCVSFITSKN